MQMTLVSKFGFYYADVNFTFYINSFCDLFWAEICVLCNFVIIKSNDKNLFQHAIEKCLTLAY